MTGTVYLLRPLYCRPCVHFNDVCFALVCVPCLWVLRFCSENLYSSILYPCKTLNNEGTAWNKVLLWTAMEESRLPTPNLNGGETKHLLNHYNTCLHLKYYYRQTWIKYRGVPFFAQWNRYNTVSASPFKQQCVLQYLQKVYLFVSVVERERSA